jgi:hypothetical protein
VSLATSLYIATTIGLFIATQTNGDWSVIKQALNDQPLTSIVVSEGVVLVGSAGGILRSTDDAKTWEKASGGHTIPCIRWMAASPKTPTLILAGTEVVFGLWRDEGPMDAAYGGAFCSSKQRIVCGIVQRGALVKKAERIRQ